MVILEAFLAGDGSRQALDTGQDEQVTGRVFRWSDDQPVRG